MLRARTCSTLRFSLVFVLALVILQMPPFSQFLPGVGSGWKSFEVL